MRLSDCTVEALVAVSDLDRARRFYEEQLGLVPDEEEPQIVHYPCAKGTGISVYLSTENAGRSPATLAGWSVEDLDGTMDERSEEHTSELQSHSDLVCRLLLEKK